MTRALRDLPLLASIAWLAASASGCGRAQAFESFTLDERDKLIVEAPGCYSECMATGVGRRTCTLKNPDCRAVCQTLLDCKLEGGRPMRVCAVVKTR